MSDNVTQLAPRSRGHDKEKSALTFQRNLRKLSQAALAKRLGVSQTLIARIELGRYRLTYKFAVEISRALECDVWEILEINDSAEWRELSRCFEELDERNRRAVLILARTLVPSPKTAASSARAPKTTKRVVRE